MTDYPTLVYNRLIIDAPLISALTGGIYLYSSLPVEGISRKDTPSAYDSTTLKMKPMLVVKGRALVPTSSLKDPETQYTSARQIIEIYLYDDPFNGWSALFGAADRVYELLQDRPSGMSSLTLVNVIDFERNSALNNCCMLRRDYEVIGRITV